MKVVSLESTVKTWFSKYYRNILCSDIPENLDTTKNDYAEFKYDFILVIRTAYGAREPNYGVGGKKFFFSDFDENLFLGQLGHADSESDINLSIRALGGAREQK